MSTSNIGSMSDVWKVGNNDEIYDDLSQFGKMKQLSAVTGHGVTVSK